MDVEKSLIRILKCIECSSNKLKLKAKSKSNSIIDGKVVCGKCGNYYSVKKGILIALPKKLDSFTKSEKKISEKLSNVVYIEHSQSRSVMTFYNNLGKYMDNFKKITSIVEIGCGNGFFLEYLNGKKPAFKLIAGTDLSFNALLNARKRTGLDNFINADSNNLPIADNVFDNVAMQGVIHHISSVQSTILEIKRILKKKGIVAIQDINFNNFIIPFVDKVILKMLLKKAGEATLVKNPVSHGKLVKLLAKGGFKINSFKFHDVIAWPSSLILDFLRLDKNYILSSLILFDNILSKIPLISNVFSWRYTVIAQKN